VHQMGAPNGSFQLNKLGLDDGDLQSCNAGQG
jgi:hypothetical protein